jgi:hypothetical protein
LVIIRNKKNIALNPTSAATIMSIYGVTATGFGLYIAIFREVYEKGIQ